MNRVNIFPFKTYGGYREYITTAENGADVFHLFLEGGDPSNPAEIKLMPGECPHCPTCTGCELGHKQLHAVRCG